MIGAVLCATGILAGVGLGIIGIAVLMVLWGLIVAFFSRVRRRDSEVRSGLVIDVRNPPHFDESFLLQRSGKIR